MKGGIHLGWFDEQIRTRDKTDQSMYEDAFQHMAGAVMGRRLSDNLNDNRRITEDAIGEILKFFRVKTRDVPEDIQDMNEVLEYLLRPYGIMRRTIFLEKGWYRDAAGAMLGKRRDDGSVVALVPFGVRRYRFYDRNTGKMVWVNRKTQDMIDREAIAFYKPFPLSRMTIAGLMRYILRMLSGADLAVLALSMLAITGVGMILPQLHNILLSTVILADSTRMLLGAGLFMICAGISSLLFGTVKSLMTARISSKLDLSVEAATMMRILSLPVDFFKDYSAGELSNRAGCINGLCGQMVSITLSTGLTSLLSLLYVAQIHRYAPSLTASALAVTFLTLLVTVLQAWVRLRITRRKLLLASKESGMSYQLIYGIQKIRLAGAERRAFARWANLYARQAELEYDPPLFLKIGSVITLAISLLGTILIYGEAVSNGVSVAEYYAFSSAYGMLNSAFMALAGIAAGVGQILPILEMAKPILDAVPEVSEEKPVVTRLNGSIEVSHVTFRYDEDMPPVLDDLSLKIRPGQYVAIVGKTGCGKSTLVRVLLGFETPQKGAVYYDGRDLKHLDLKSLRRRIGSVLQDGKLFSGDILSNITLNAPWLTMQEAWEAASAAGIASDIMMMPMGMHTLISENQGSISGGQRQRLLIARAIAPRPKILIFDEATSALDNLTQKQVSEALTRMKCTRIVVAHRLSTIRQCNRIIVLDGGKIAEDGTYDELMARQGIFAELVSRQQVNPSGETYTENTVPEAGNGGESIQ